MKFEYTELAELPALAWCAVYRSRSDRIRIVHGSWVETNDEWFHEGAWNGPFGQGGFVEATENFGTGARLRKDGVEFSSPSHPCRHLLTLKLDDRTLISNSLPFLLTMARLRPDVTNTNYHRNLLNIVRAGFREKPSALPFPNGRRVMFHANSNLVFHSGKRATRSRRIDAADGPKDFEDYRDRLVAALDGLRRNASDMQRRKVFEPVTTISRGYDSTACAALGAVAGWKRALTLGSSDAADDGTRIGEKLGLIVERVDGGDWKLLPDAPEAEFLVTAGAGVMVRFAVMQQQLAGTLALVGVMGGQVWSPRADGVEPDWSRPKLKQVGAESLWEFSLRNGIVFVYPALIGANRREEIRRISTSARMQPWSVGGAYDRPIARRLVEDLGVPRDWFGREKMATSHVVPAIEMSASAQAERVKFLARVAKESRGKAPTGRQGALLFHWAMQRTMRRYRAVRDVKLD